MLGIGAPAMAQVVDNKATIEAISKVIKENPAAAASQVKELVKKNKKNAEVLTGIGRAYLDAKDTQNADVYADMAIKANKSFGSAYVLKGDIQAVLDDGGAASSWYENAIHFDPKNPDGYRRYAQVNSKTSPTLAVQKLEELRAQRPDYPVDIISAEIYDKVGNINKALEYYDKVDKAKMEDYQLASYAVNYFLKGDFEKSLSISQYGNQKFPKSAALNRISFFDLTNLKRYDEALKYADALFNNSENTKITESDYLYYGYAYLGAKDYDNAIEMFNKSLENNADNKEDRSDALKNIANAYQGKGDITKAAESYDQYLKSLDKISAYDMGTLATMYQTYAAGVEDEAVKRSALDKADGVWAEIAEKFPSVATVATYNRAHIAFSLDPETEQGLAKPHYTKLVEMLENKTDRDSKDDSYLVEAYRYLGYYYLLQKDKATADNYWNKILAIDPENETAKQALGK